MIGNGASVARNLLAPADRPRLLPSNRKLRHLQGITLRNLNLSPSATRSRGKTIDDDALPSTHRSPTQLLDSEQTSKLVHSRSYSDLNSAQNVSTLPEDAVAVTGNTKHDAIKRTPIRRTRRRSTLDWNYASPRQRQLKLEESMSTRMGDLFFSLHVTDADEPVYVSELIEHTMNSNFRFFDLNTCSPAVTRLDQCIIRFWSRQNRTTRWQHHIEMPIKLGSLKFLGKDLEGYHRPFPVNCILLHMSDGLYGPSELLAEEDLLATLEPVSFTPTSYLEPTSSYDALMRLSTLDDCIQDALATRKRLNAEIQVLLEEESSSITSRDLHIAKNSLGSVNSAITNERNRIKSSTKRRDALVSSHQSRREAMQRGRETHDRSHEHLDISRPSLKECQASDKQSIEDMVGQRRRICEDLLQIYPIEAIPRQPLSFTIRGLHLPNSTFENGKDDDVIAAALGMVAHLVYLLSFYLSMPLPYPIQPLSSASLITDSISLMAGSHVFPLFMKGSVFYRFEYGVFLLNKNIELLSAKLGVTVMDIRQTLPNLKYLLYVATAGQGELPARKSGGVRAFLRGPRLGSVASSRRASNDSGHLRRLDSLRSELLANGDTC